jgi:hypothetical protein
LELSIDPDGTYHVGYTSPVGVDVVLHIDALCKYSTFFNHYLRIIKIEQSISKSWISIVGLFRKQFNGLVYLQSVDELMRRMNYLRSRLWKWVHGLRYVVCFEVIQPAWTMLVNTNHETLDSLIHSHDHYISTIIERSFVRNNQLVNVLSVLERYINCEMAIHTELDACMHNDVDISPFRFKNIHELLSDIDDSFSVGIDEFDVHIQALSQISSDMGKQEFYDRLRSQLNGIFVEVEETYKVLA